MLIYKLIWKSEVLLYKDVILYLLCLYVIDFNYFKKLNSIIKYYYLIFFDKEKMFNMKKYNKLIGMDVFGNDFKLFIEIFGILFYLYG